MRYTEEMFTDVELVGLEVAYRLESFMQKFGGGMHFERCMINRRESYRGGRT